MAARKLRLRGTDQRVVLALGSLTGVGLALRGASPTGSTVTDWIVILASCTGAVWAMSTAPWWALSGLAAIAAAIADPWIPTLIGCALFLFSLAVGAVRRSQPIERAAVAGGTILVLSLARELQWFGVNAAVSIVGVTIVAALGLRRRSRRDRKVAYVALGVTATVTAFAGLGLLVAGTAARPDLTEGNRVARQGLRELKAGQWSEAQQSFGRAADAFARADDDLDALWVQPTRLLPIASQHREAAVTISSAASSASSTIETQLGEIDFDRLRIIDGRIDVDAVASLQAPMLELQAALDELDQAAIDAYDPWLVDPLKVRLADLRAEVAEQQQYGDKANQALAVAPAMLGADGERVYFVMFTTPAEARGSGGFMGNYAEITVDQGVIEMTAFGRHSDLNHAADGNLALNDPPQDWLARYGPQGFAIGPEGDVAADAWSTINMSPHFPYTAQVIADLYPQSGGRDLDGVFSIDVFALQELIGLVGPITLDDGTTLDGANAAEYLLVDQYRIENLDENVDRIDQLEVIARETTTRLLSTNPPDPIELGKAMAPMAREGRALAWLGRPEEQAMLQAVRIDGALLSGLDGSDGLAVVAVNDGASKMDTYLGRSMRLSPTETGDRLDVTVSHDAPVDQLTEFAIGQTTDLPSGWARIWLTLNTTRPAESVLLDGNPVSVSSTQEAGVQNYGLILQLEPGSSQTVTFDLVGHSAHAGLVIDPQPLVESEVWQVDGTIVGAVESSTAVR